MGTIPNQTERIRAALEAGHRITPYDALNLYNCFRLGARIWDLRATGMAIQSRMKKLKNGKHVAEYYLLNQTIKKQKV